MPTTTLARSRSSVSSAAADVADRTVGQRRRAEPLEAARQKLADAARTLAGQQDEDAIARPGQHRHAVMEEVDRELLVGGAEVDALGLAGRARRGQGDDPLDLAGGHAQQTHALSPDVVGGREGQPRDVVERGDVARPHGGQSVGVEAAAVAGAGDRLTQGAQLVPAQALHVGGAGPTQDPRFERRGPSAGRARARHDALSPAATRSRPGAARPRARAHRRP